MDEEVSSRNNGANATGDLEDTRLHPLGVSSTLRLKFQQSIVEEMIQEDSILILGKGLGLESIVANLLHILSASTTLSNTNKRSLVILLNATELENEKISDELLELTWNDSYINKDRRDRQFAIIGGDAVTSDKRSKIYQGGGIVSLSNQVLLLDLLNKVVDPSLITGIVVLHAERTSELSNDAFIIDLYRQVNKWGFVKGVSERPEDFTYGFSNLSSKLKYLKLERVNLWPRFHLDVLTSLAPSQRKKQQPQIRNHNLINEIKVFMTDSMKQIQTGLLTAAQLNISHLRSRNPEIMTEYWTVDNFPEKNFMRSLRITLDPVWHRLNDSTKQCLYDLTTIKELLDYLFSYDALKFNQMMQDLVSRDKHAHVSRRSPWLLSPEAGMPAIESALDRVGRINKFNKNGDIEELPKWNQLACILDEIYTAKQDRDDSNDGPILIACSSYQVSNQLKMYLSSCEQKKSNDRVYYSGKRLINRLRKVYNPKSMLNKKKLNEELTKLENKEAQNDDNNNNGGSGNGSSSDGPVRLSRSGVPISKRRRTRGASVVAAIGRSSIPDNGSPNLEILDGDDDVEANGDDNEDEEYSDTSDEEEEDRNANLESFLTQMGFDGNNDQTGGFPNLDEISSCDRKDQILIEVFDDQGNDTILQELMPSYIIAYEPNLTFFRSVELYQATRKQNPAFVYSMVYLGSVEEQRFLIETKKEKDAFTKLVRDKAAMAQHFSTDSDNNKFQIRKNNVVNTRIAGGSSHFGTAADEQVVVVDTREFRSSLPYVCHQMGIKVVPCMISVGDYIISPNLCVERKAIPDLVSSLKSGRLYQQCENMFRFYKTPILLIEFQEGKSFSFAPFVDLRPRRLQEYSQQFMDDIQMKLIMLLIAFPRLKIIWSSSVHQTAQIFMELKAGQQQPDPEEALSKGDLLDGSSLYNDAAIDLIRHIPGINHTNYHLVIHKVNSIYDLSMMREEDLASLIGNEAASKVHSFFNESINGV